MKTKCWIIVKSDDWEESRIRGSMTERIPERSRPTCVHYSKDKAESELLRLEANYGRRFVLFESIAYAKPIGDGMEYQVEAIHE